MCWRWTSSGKIYFVMQETLLNLLLRNYLHYNLYDQAEKLRSKAPRFEAHSNQQVWPISQFTEYPYPNDYDFYVCCNLDFEVALKKASSYGSCP